MAGLICTRGLGRKGTTPSLLSTAGLGFGLPVAPPGSIGSIDRADALRVLCREDEIRLLMRGDTKVTTCRADEDRFLVAVATLRSLCRGDEKRTIDPKPPRGTP